MAQKRTDWTGMLIGTVGFLTLLLPVAICLGALPGIVLHSTTLAVVGACAGAISATALLIGMAGSD